MGELQDVIAAMEQADVELGMEFVRAAQADGEVVLPWQLAVHIGTEGLRRLSEAFGLEFDQVLDVTSAHGARMSAAMLPHLGVQPCREHAEFYAGLVTSGLMTGLRIGLLISHRRGGS